MSVFFCVCSVHMCKTQGYIPKNCKDYSIRQDNSKLFSKVIVPVYIPLIVYQAPTEPLSLPKL